MIRCHTQLTTESVGTELETEVRPRRRQTEWQNVNVERMQRTHSSLMLRAQKIKWPKKET